MPELPEVETVRRGLAPVLAGALITDIDVRRPDLRFPFPERFAERVRGRRLVSLSRRAKYLVAALDSGESIIMHLGMTGRFTIVEAADAVRVGAAVEAASKPMSRSTNGAASLTASHSAPRPASGSGRGKQVAEDAFAHPVGPDPKHDHVILRTDAGHVVTYNDPRRFGFMLMLDEDEFSTHKMFKDLGPEPLGNLFNATTLATAGRGRRNDLKAFLLDQRTVAGLGNIYVCEALHRSQISPKRRAACLCDRKGQPTARADRLSHAIREVLSEAIEAGGSTLRDYAHTDGSLGYFQKAFAVYGREGEPCRRAGCSGTVQRLVQAGRSTFYCSRCQR
ncbi:MAG: bifunctional DNA-formamidopyrimidine glycosylase/DNA-(apurinic or apyrimidinic site) lyase [Pseudomonadota bacterium]